MPTGQDIAISSAAPQALPLDLQSTLNRAFNAVRAGDLNADDLPSEAREALKIRRNALATALAAPGADFVRKILAGIFAMPNRAQEDPRVERLVVEQYLAVLGDVPRWALEWAVWAFVRGDAGAGFRPSPAELRTFAMRRVEPFLVERHCIDAVLIARIAPPKKSLNVEDRKRLGGMMRQLGADVAMGGLAAEKQRGGFVADEETPEELIDREDARGVADPDARTAIINRKMDKLERLQAEYASTPPTIGPALQARLSDDDEQRNAS